MPQQAARLTTPIITDMRGLRTKLTALQEEGGGSPSNAVPLQDGIGWPGVSALYARGDHIHPTDTSRAAVSHIHAQADVTNLVTDLALKAPLASPTLTGVPAAPTASLGTSTTQLATTAFVAAAVSGATGGTIGEAPNDGQTYGRKSLGWSTLDTSIDWTEVTGKPSTFPPSAHNHVIADTTGLQAGLDAKEPTIAAGTAAQYWRGTKVWATLDKAAVGLANVDNTSDANKPVSTATQTALNGKAASVHTHLWVDITDKPASFTPSAHNHPQSEVTNLVTDLGLKAPLASPTFTGDPKAPTPSPGDNDTRIATTAFVTAAMTAAGSVNPSNANPLQDGTAAPGTSVLYARGDHVHPTDASRAPLASPALTGTPTAPTASAGTSTTQVATTAFVGTAVTNAAVPAPATVAPLMDGTAAVGTTTKYAREDHKHPVDTSRAASTHTHAQADVTNLTTDLGLKAPLASPVFTGDARAVTPTAGDNDTSIATTAFVTAANALKVSKAGDTMTGQLEISHASPTILLRKTTGSSDVIGHHSSSGPRWLLRLGNDAVETGSNVGSDFVLYRHNDAGAVIDGVFYIQRSSGNAGFSSDLTWTGAAWTAFTPTCVCSSGSATATMRYKLFGKFCMFSVTVNGSVTGALSYFTLPVNSHASTNGFIVGRETNRTGIVWYGHITGVGQMAFMGSPNNNAFNAGDRMVASGGYETV